MDLNGKWISIIGAAATVVSIGASLVSGWVGDKKIDQKITEKVNDAVAKKIETAGKS